MTPVIIIAAFMVASFALAVLIGKCMDTDTGDLHDGATMRADRANLRAVNNAAEDQARAAFYDQFGRNPQ